MFERFKKAFAKDKEPDAAAMNSQMPQSQVSEWAGTQGFAFSGQGNAFALDGKVGNKTWRMERGKPSRNFIRGEELRGRCELGVDEDISVLVMNRPLKQALEKKAYALYTDSLQTTADPNLPEEMRWLAMYDEVGWDSLPLAFWDRYSILTDQREHALGWVDPILADLLMSWPEPGPSAEVPFMLMLLRGKAYLRMEYTPADMPTLQHAATIFTTACESAMGGLSDIAI
ncbi:MAG: hypothetical protein V4757_14335 [Pseudomonadota bacterium]